MFPALLLSVAILAAVAVLAVWFLRWLLGRDDTAELLADDEPVVLPSVDYLADEVWTFTRVMEPARIYKELAYATAIDWKTDLEVSA